MGMAAYPIDSCMLEVLEDPRAPLIQGNLRDGMNTELQWLEGLSEPFWESLSPACGIPAVELRSNSIDCALTACSFFQSRGLDEITKLPWSLGVGDVKQKLLDLFVADCPDEPVAAKIWMLLQINQADDDILEDLTAALKLLMDCPWSTLCTEQLHSFFSNPEVLSRDQGACLSPVKINAGVA